MAPLSPIRKGAKSCVECRLRKVRCDWADDAPSCSNCQKRGSKCAPQLFKRPSASGRQMTPRQRISTLERRLGSLAAAVEQREYASQPASRIIRNRNTETKDQFAAPFVTHLNPLFDNELIELGDQNASHDLDGAQAAPCSQQYLDDIRRRLQRLVPAKPEVEALAKHAGPWLSIYQNIFMSISSLQTGEQLVARYESMMTDDAHPIAIGTFLSSLAITAQQLPQGSKTGPKDLQNWIMDVISEVDATIVSHDGLAATLEGIELMTVYMRILLRMGYIRNLWLTLRRTMALAELVGLPRFARRRSTHAEPSRIAYGRTLWRTICATDRLASMIFNLPSATASHRFCCADLIDRDGNVILSEYTFRLSSFSGLVQELENLHNDRLPVEEFYPKVLAADHEIRSLSAQTEFSWWMDPQRHPSWVQLVQFWQHYMLVRTHLPFAMLKDARNQLVYSRISCLHACQDLATRYLSLRPGLPHGFFICRIVDMQIFAAAIFLLLASRTRNNSFFANFHAVIEVGKIQDLLDKVVELLESICTQSGSEFLRDAVDAIHSLAAQFDAPEADSQACSLNVPMLGQIRIRRKSAMVASNGNGSMESLQLHAVNNHIPESTSGQSLFPDTPSWLWELDTDPLQAGLGLDMWSDLNLWPEYKENDGNMFI